MKKETFNGSAQKEEMTREKIENALEVFLHNNSILKDYGVTPYVAEDLKSFGLKALVEPMAYHLTTHLCYATGAITMTEKNKTGDYVVCVKTEDAQKSFFTAKKQEKFSVKIARAIKKLRK